MKNVLLMIEVIFMKKTFKRVLLLGLALALSISSGVVFAEDYSNKLSKDFQTYLDTINNTDTANIVVYATGEVEYLSQEEYEKKVIEIMGEEEYRFALTGSPQYTEQVNKLLELEKQFKKEAEQVFQKGFMEEIGLKATDDMVMSGVSIAFTATKEEILRLAEEKRVNYILWIQDEKPVPDDTTATTDLGNGVIQVLADENYIYQYSAISALHILKACVGKEVGSINPVYDVNADGEISAQDALWALQSAVGKRVVEYPLDYCFPE